MGNGDVTCEKNSVYSLLGKKYSNIFHGFFLIAIVGNPEFFN